MSPFSLGIIFLQVQHVHDDVCSVTFLEYEVFKFAFVSVQILLQIIAKYASCVQAR